MTQDRTPVRRRVRVRPVLVALAVLASSLPAWGGSAAAAPRGVALAGRTIVEGDETGGMRVHIPRPVKIDLDSGVRIRGDGRLAGVVLTRPDVTTYERDSFEAIRFGYCETPGCKPQKTSHQYLYGRGGSNVEVEGAIELPAGTYLLYLLADDAPVRVTLRLRGLKGSKVLRPRRPVDSGFAVPNADNSTSSPGDDSFWWGDEFDLTGDAGYVFAVLSMDVENWLDVHYGDCAYVMGPPPPRPLAYSPPCPGGIGAFANESTRLPASNSFEVPMFAEIGAPGQYGYGLYYTGAADVTNRFSLFFHMSLDPASL